MLSREIVDTYTEILKEELIPAMGCTEPIAVAYAGALARETLGAQPQTVELVVSGNIIKNVKSVIVPHTNGRKGLQTAVAAGICFGKAEKVLEVISEANDSQLSDMDTFLQEAEIIVRESSARCPFDIQVTVRSEKNSAYVRIMGHDTKVVCVRRGTEYLVNKPVSEERVPVPENRGLLNVRDIVTFANEVNLDLVRGILEEQIHCNMAIAEAGMHGHYGADIGKILIRSYGNSVQNRAKAYAAAGSDARMNGCELPVVINSGSGNQGMTASLPVVEYAKEYNKTEEELIRAVILSDLITIHQKSKIGRLSAFCGAISAGCGAAAGIAYLLGGDYDTIAHTLVNSLAIVSGIVCDGAKASCAGKIAAAVNAGILGYNMYLNGSQFWAGDGIVSKGVENTIRNVGRLGRDGMRETDREILKIMTEE